MNVQTKAVMNRKLIFIFCVFAFSVNLLNAQSVLLKDLYGKWNVSDWIILNTTQQTNDEKNDFEKQKNCSL